MGPQRNRRARAQTRPANRPTCRPEMANRCIVPLRMNMLRCPSSNSSRSPRSNAAATGAVRGERCRARILFPAVRSSARKRRNRSVECFENPVRRTPPAVLTINRPETPCRARKLRMSKPPGFLAGAGRFSQPVIDTRSPTCSPRVRSLTMTCSRPVTGSKWDRRRMVSTRSCHRVVGR